MNKSLTDYLVAQTVKKLKKALERNDQRTINKLKKKFGDDIVDLYWESK